MAQYLIDNVGIIALIIELTAAIIMGILEIIESDDKGRGLRHLIMYVVLGAVMVGAVFFKITECIVALIIFIVLFVFVCCRLFRF